MSAAAADNALPRVARTGQAQVIFMLRAAIISCVATSFYTSLSVVGVAHAAPFAYISNLGDATVSVVDLATNSVANTVSVGNHPFGIAVNGSGTRVYVTNQFSHSMSVIDTATNTVVTTVPVGQSPSGIAVNPVLREGYVASLGDNTLKVFDTTTNALADSITVGAAPLGVAVDPAGKRVYVTNSSDGTLTIVDATSHTAIAIVTLGTFVFPIPKGVVVHPNGKLVYVANSIYLVSTVSVIDATANPPSVIATIPVASNPEELAVSPDGKRLFVLSALGASISVVDTASNTVVRTVKVGNLPPYPTGIGVTSTGAELVIALYGSNGDGVVQVLDATTFAVKATISVGNTPAPFGLFLTAGGGTAPEAQPIPALNGWALLVLAGLAAAIAYLSHVVGAPKARSAVAITHPAAPDVHVSAAAVSIQSDAKTVSGLR